MEVQLFSSILKDASFFNYSKMRYKYGQAFSDCLKVLSEYYYRKLEVCDFSGKPMVYIENTGMLRPRSKTIKLLMRDRGASYGIKAFEEEMIATAFIENIDFSRDSVRHVLNGLAPRDDMENRIAGLKKGLEFIADNNHKITEKNLYELYQMTIGNFLDQNDQLQTGNDYRHDTVYVISDQIDHCGLSWEKIPKAMKDLMDFINQDDDIEELSKAAMIHYIFAYIHPYLDGNGRMARLLHLWFLVQKGYHSALFIPFSSQIERVRKDYYRAFTQIEENRKISGVMDLTPFVHFFVYQVYNRLSDEVVEFSADERFRQAEMEGKITEKEVLLWRFILSHYGRIAFSTKELEKDYRDVAYGTVRTFVMKFEKMGLLLKINYGSRPKYRITGSNEEIKTS